MGRNAGNRVLRGDYDEIKQIPTRVVLFRGIRIRSGLLDRCDVCGVVDDVGSFVTSRSLAPWSLVYARLCRLEKAPGSLAARSSPTSQGSTVGPHSSDLCVYLILIR